MASGEIGAAHGDTVAELIIGMIWSAVASFGGDGRAIARTVTGLVLRGLLPRAGAPNATSDWAPRRSGDARSAILEEAP